MAFRNGLTYLAQPPSNIATNNWDLTADATYQNFGPPAQIWIGINPGETCILKIDAGGQTGISIPNLMRGWWKIPVSNLTKIYAASNGSTGISDITVAG